MSVTPPPGGARCRSALRWSCHGTSWFYPISLHPGLDREEATCSHHLGAPSATAGQAQGNGEAIETEGQVKPPRRSRSRLVPAAPRLTRILLRQGPDPHLSKSEVSRLADRVAALSFGVKLLTYLEELGFLTTHSGAELKWGRSGDLCTRSIPLPIMLHTGSDGGTKEDGPDAWS